MENKITLSFQERNEGFALLAKLHREGKKLTASEMERMEYLIDLAAEEDYLTLGYTGHEPFKEKRKAAIKATYIRDLWG